MKNQDVIRNRYLNDDLPTRLGGLAANLSRIKSFASHDKNREAVKRLIDESKYFIEWTAAEADISTAAELVELQIQLARWGLNWESIWKDTNQRNQVTEQAAQWSKLVLKMSGLLE